ncbi:hypothetical protein D9M73_219370 [compost metagenome]
MDANFHTNGNRLALGNAQQPRHPIAHRQAQQVEQQRRQAHHRCVLDHCLPVLGQCQDDGEGQEQRSHQLHRLFHARSERRGKMANQHAQRNRQQDDGEHLHDLGELQWNSLVRGHEPTQRQVHQQRHGQDRDQ